MPIPEQLKPEITARIKSGELRTNDEIRSFIAQRLAQSQTVQAKQGRGFFSAGLAGLRRSVSGLALGGDLPGEFDPEGILENIGYGAGQFAGDLPIIIPATIGATVLGGPLIGGAVGFGAGGLARESLIQAKDVDEQTFLQELGEVGKTTAFETALGLGAGLLGKGIKAIAKPTVQAVAKTPIGKATGELLKELRIMRRLKPKQSLMGTEELGKRVPKVEAAILRQYGKGISDKGIAEITSPLKGELPKPLYKPKISDKSKIELANVVQSKETFLKVDTFEAMRGNIALNKVFNGEILQPGEIRTMRKIYGDALADELNKMRPLGTRFKEAFYDIANIPRSVLASFDQSYPLRQGVVLAPASPKIFLQALRKQWQAFFSESRAKTIRDQILKDPLFKQATAKARRGGAGLELTEWGVKDLSGAEEQYMSNYVRKLWGIRHSERAFVTAANHQRFEVYKKYAAQLRRQGITFKDKPTEYRKLANFINAATGRGQLGPLAGAGQFLNATVFSPRLLAGRIQVVGQFSKSLPGLLEVFKRDKSVRGIVASNVVAFVGTGVALLSMAKLGFGGKAQVESDPRSSDFGKIKVGNTRIDVWGGYSQLARFVTQLIFNQRKATTTKRIYDINRLNTTTRFLQTKASPLMGAVIDFMKGENFLGEPISAQHIDKEVYNRFMPLFTQDLIDAIRFQGLDGAILTAPAFWGIGAQTYEESDFSKLSQYKDGLAQHTFGRKWGELSFNQQRALTATHPEIEAKRREAVFKSKRPAPIEESIKQQAIIGQKVQKRLNPIIKKELDNSKIKITGFARNIAGGFHLNDKRYKQYQDLSVQNINDIIPAIIKQSGWKQLPLTWRQDIIKKAIDRAKEFARRQVIALSEQTNE